MPARKGHKVCGYTLDCPNRKFSLADLPGRRQSLLDRKGSADGGRTARKARLSRGTAADFPGVRIDGVGKTVKFFAVNRSDLSGLVFEIKW
jgi:hypothetical protein